jgi:hypothetical protein
MAEPHYETIRCEIADGVAAITLDRPDVLNAMDDGMRRELTRCFTAIAGDDDVRVVVVTGAGERAFSAGADIREFVEPLVPVRFREQRRLLDFRQVMDRCPQPIIAAIAATRSAEASSWPWPATSGSPARTRSSASPRSTWPSSPAVGAPSACPGSWDAARRSR